jgi:hypothetical protein
MAANQPYTPQTRLRRWLREHGYKHRWAAGRLGYTPQYFSRVLNGQEPLSDKFRRRCTETLEVPDDVWLGPEPAR